MRRDPSNSVDGSTESRICPTRYVMDDHLALRDAVARRGLEKMQSCALHQVLLTPDPTAICNAMVIVRSERSGRQPGCRGTSRLWLLRGVSGQKINFNAN
jgi:hypothetical protein